MTDDGQREQDAELTAMRAALVLPGPWPAATTVRTQNVEVLDVDRYDGFGVVLAAVERSVLGHGPALRASVFRKDATWQSMFGGGGGGGQIDPVVERQWINPDTVILRRGGGRRRPMPHEQGPTICYAEVICSPAVAAVVVDRPADRRFADVTVGSGWISIVWPEGSEPRVTALGQAGEELDYLDPGLFRDG